VTDPVGPPEKEGDRTRQNIVVLCGLLGLLLCGLWLFSALKSYLQIEACLEAGYRNCAPADRGASE
jgi:hypothetical protein